MVLRNLHHIINYLEIFPNPVHNPVELHWEECHGNEVLLYNSLGKLTNLSKLNLNAEGCTFSVESFSPGMYFALVKTLNGLLTRKLIVE